MTKTSRKPHAETTKDPRFNVSPFYILARPGFDPNSGGVFGTQRLFQKIPGFQLISDLIE